MRRDQSGSIPEVSEEAPNEQVDARPSKQQARRDEQRQWFPFQVASDTINGQAWPETVG
jgi:hypothetical protein